MDEILSSASFDRADQNKGNQLIEKNPIITFDNSSEKFRINEANLMVKTIQEEDPVD